MKAQRNSWSVQYRIIWLVLLPCCQVSDCTDSFETNIGGTYRSNHTISVVSSPYVATSDITVGNGSTLTIEAGVRINFQARVKLHVRGTLVARGSPDNEIVMFHNMTVGVNSSSIRLVGGQNPREGRVEVFNGHGWGTVCSDSWSSANARVVCRHLGFGHPIETSTLRFGQGSDDSSSPRVDCEGTENSLFECKRTSSHSNNNCPNSQHVGIVCGTVGIGYWGGIVFDADDSEEYVVYYARKYKSNSVLENVEIIGAGMIPETYSQRPDRRVAAITMKTSSPTITNVSITNSSYTGIDMSALHSDVHFSGLTIENSSSSGIVGSYSWQFHCSACRLSDIGNAGIDAKAIPPLLDRSSTGSVPIYNKTSLLDTVYHIDDRGAYLILSLSRSGRYTSTITTSHGHGLILEFPRPLFYRGWLSIVDGVTTETLLSVHSSGLPSTVAIASYKVLLIYNRYSSSASVDIRVFISSYPIGARGETLTDCTVTGYGSWVTGIRLSGSTGVRKIVSPVVKGKIDSGIQLKGSTNEVIISSASVANSVRSRWTSTGINAGDARSISLQITGCQVQGFGTGMNLYIRGAIHVFIDNCTVSHSTQTGVYISLNFYASHSSTTLLQRLQISNCTFSDISGKQALYIHLHNTYSAAEIMQVNITQNVFERNLQGLYVYRDSYSHGVSVTVDRNTFSYNNGGCCSGALSVYDDIYAAHYAERWPIILENNVFLENSGGYVAMLRTQSYTSRHYQQGTDSLVFQNNTMTNNSLSPDVKSNPAVIVIAGSIFVTVKHNIFDNPNASTELAVRVSVFSSVDDKVDVTLNWWGTSNETKITEKIFDFDDRNYLATVIYFPFLLSPSASDVAPADHPRKYPPFLNHDNEIGGQLATDFILSFGKGPYTVTRDITVLPEATLIIEAGTVVKFRPLVGLLVEGSLITKGTLNSPVIFKPAVSTASLPSDKQSVVRLVQGYSSPTYINGYVEMQFDEVWRPLCMRPHPDYGSLDRISRLVCQALEIHDGKLISSWWSNTWFPALGDPIVHGLSCPENASSLGDCSFNTAAYAPHSGCLRTLYVGCHCTECQFATSTAKGKWAGVRFVPTSSIPTDSSSHRTPRSFLNYTEINGAGQRDDMTVPSVQAIFRPPETKRLTITDSASTAMEVSYLHEDAVIRSLNIIGANGNGLAVRRPRGQSLVIESINVQNVTNSGIVIYSYMTELVARSDYQSICSGQNTIVVDAIEGSYVGVTQQDYSPGITCSVVLSGPSNTVLSVRVVTFRLHHDNVIYIRDGAQSDSSLLKHYQGSSSYLSLGSFYLGDLIISSGNNVFVEVRMAQRSDAPIFSLYVDTVSATGDLPSVTIKDSSVYNAREGVYVVNVDDDALVKNITVVNALNEGVYFSSHDGNVTVSNCHIVNVGNIGIGAIYGDGRVTIIDNTIDNSSQGIHAYSTVNIPRKTNCDVIMSGNNISAATTRAGYLYLYSYGYYYYDYYYWFGYYDYYDYYDYKNKDSRCSYTISGNAFVSSFDGLQTSFEFELQGSLLSIHTNVSNNLFSDNSGTDVSFSSHGNLNMNISDNTFERHRPGSGGCLLLQGSVAALEVTNNSFTGNKGAFVVRMAPENDTKYPFVFANNELTDNFVNESDGHRQDNRSAVVVIAVSRQFVIENNSFNNSESRFELSVEIPVQSSTEPVISMARNYWGTTDENEIADRIHDFGYCSRLASAEYFPYLTSPFGKPVSSSVSRNTHIIRRNGIVRGRVANDTVLLASGGPYVVTGDISVLPGRKLTIEAGAELRFTQNTGILVEGQLIVQGKPTSSVLFTDNNLQPVARKEESYSLRLVGGLSPRKGRVEIFYNGSWGPICVAQNQYPRPATSHDYANTRVVCSELGFTGANWQPRYVDSHITDSKDSAWLEHLLCSWDVDTLRQCTNYILKKATCRYGQLVASCYSYVEFDGREVKSDKSFTHWTGIRFAAGATGVSSLRHVLINSAGIANAGHAPAIQCVGANVSFFNVTVNNSAWTALEITHSPLLNISHSEITNNDGSGVQLTNVAASSLTSVISRENKGHGLAITIDSILQRMWNIPVLYENIVDICAHSGPIPASTPFFLRFTSTPSKGTSYSCTASIQASSRHVLSIHVMAVRFRGRAYVTIDSHSVFESGRLRSLHYTSNNGSTSVSIEEYKYFPGESYFLAYIERHPKRQTSETRHRIANASLVGNDLSGLTFNTSQDSSKRYDLHLSDSTVSDNDLTGVDVAGDNVSIYTFDNAISRNGRLSNGVPFLYKKATGGLVMKLNHSTVVVENNTFQANRGGSVVIQLDRDSEASFINVSDNWINENSEGPAISLFETADYGIISDSGMMLDPTVGPTSGKTRVRPHSRASVVNNHISHNSAGTQYDTLFITNVNANVSGNTFFNNTCRYVVLWKTDPDGLATDQDCSENTFYQNTGESPNNKWTIAADGVATRYTKNIFFNPANTYEFVAGTDLHQGNHDVRNNWWGPKIASAGEAEKRVLDKNDSKFRARVDIQPIDIVNPWLNTSVCPPYWRTIASICYVYVQDARNWSASITYCQMVGGHLAPSLSDEIYFTLVESWSTNKGVWVELTTPNLANPSKGHCPIRRPNGSASDSCGLFRSFVCHIASSGTVIPPTILSLTTTRTVSTGGSTSTQTLPISTHIREPTTETYTDTVIENTNNHTVAHVTSAIMAITGTQTPHYVPTTILSAPEASTSGIESGVIAGIVVAALSVLFIVLLIVVVVRYRMKNNFKPVIGGEPEPLPVGPKVVSVTNPMYQEDAGEFKYLDDEIFQVDQNENVPDYQSVTDVTWKGSNAHSPLV